MNATRDGCHLGLLTGFTTGDPGAPCTLWHMTQHLVTPGGPAAGDHAQAIVLDSVSRSFGPVLAVDRLSLIVERGQTLALLGARPDAHGIEVSGVAIEDAFIVITDSIAA